MPKSGSTTIQLAFRGLQSDRAFYADLKQPNHSKPLITMFAADGEHYFMNRLDGIEYVVYRRFSIDARLQLVCKHVKQYFRIRIRRQVTPVLTDQHLREFVVVGQVAVVRQANAVG